MNKEQNAALEAERAAFEAWWPQDRKTIDKANALALFRHARAQLAAPAGAERALIRQAMNLLNLRNHVPGSDVDLCVKALADMLEGKQSPAPEPSAEWLEVARIAAPAGVPDGWRLVPVEPTKAMRLIGARDCSALIQPDQAAEVWRAMIGAALVPAEYAFPAAPSPAPASENPAQVMGRVYDGKAELNSIGRALPDHSPLYAEPAPASDVVQVPTFCAYCGGNDEDPQEHCTDCAQPVAVPRHLLEDLRDLASDAAEHHRAAYASHKPARQASIDSTVEAARALLNGGRV